MKSVIFWILTAVVGLLLAAVLLQVIASESGEVVVLETREGDGQARTRLWVVEDDGHLWLRGGASSGWQQRLLAQPLVNLERGGVRNSYRAEPEPTRTARINALMAEKYGWRDTVVGWFVGDRSSDIAVRLVPRSED